MICSDCNGEGCFTCNHVGDLCDTCGESAQDRGASFCEACDPDLKEEREEAKAEAIKHRKLWLPKRKECEQCPSCPFRDDNHAEFRKIITRLKHANGDDTPANAYEVLMARAKIKAELTHSGDFSCHCSVYNTDMSRKPESGWRQCPGATQFWKEGGNA